MSGRERPRALVVVRDGPATERGWLALRTALALGLGGFDVSVWLMDAGVAFAADDLDVGRWLGGDPKADVRGLLDDVGARVHTDGWVPAIAAMHPVTLAAGIPSPLDDEVVFAQLYADADLVMCS